MQQSQLQNREEVFKLFLNDVKNKFYLDETSKSLIVDNQKVLLKYLKLNPSESLQKGVLKFFNIRYFKPYENMPEKDFLENVRKLKLMKSDENYRDHIYTDYRMYFLINNKLSEIQKGIQAGHASIIFTNKFDESDAYLKFLKTKTWVLLNGGTHQNLYGHLQTLSSKFKLDVASFQEIDLNNSLTAICFLVPSRVYDSITYPGPDENGGLGMLNKIELELRAFIKQFRLA